MPPLLPTRSYAYVIAMRAWQKYSQKHIFIRSSQPLLKWNDVVSRSHSANGGSCTQNQLSRYQLARESNSLYVSNFCEISCSWVQLNMQSTLKKSTPSTHTLNPNTPRSCMRINWVDFMRVHHIQSWTCELLIWQKVYVLIKIALVQVDPMKVDPVCTPHNAYLQSLTPQHVVSSSHHA